MKKWKLLYLEAFMHPVLICLDEETGIRKVKHDPFGKYVASVTWREGAIEVPEDNPLATTGITFKNIEAATPSSIAHASLHLVYDIFDIKGVPISYDNQKTVAYHLGWLVSEITDYIESYKKWQKKENARKKK